MSDLTLRAALKARLIAHGAIIGRVHDYSRWAVTEEKFKELFLDNATRKLFGWELTRKSFRTERISKSTWKRTSTYLLRGYYGLQDSAATELEISALVDAIVDDLATVRLAGSTVDANPSGTLDNWMFGSILCHRAAIELTTCENIEAADPDADALDLTEILGSYYLTPGDALPDATDTITITVD